MFGGVERGTGKCFMVQVERNAETLLLLIQEWIASGSHMHDGWRACNDNHLLPEYHTHSTMTHAENFVDPQDENIHTQGIESRWSDTKASIRRKYGTTEHLFETYLVEYMWRTRIHYSPSSSILVSIAEQYAVYCYLPLKHKRIPTRARARAQKNPINQPFRLEVLRRNLRIRTFHLDQVLHRQYVNNSKG